MISNNTLCNTINKTATLRAIEEAISFKCMEPLRGNFVTVQQAVYTSGGGSVLYHSFHLILRHLEVIYDQSKKEKVPAVIADNYNFYFKYE